MLSGGLRHWQPAHHTDWRVHLKNATFVVMIEKTAEKIEATHSLLPRKPNRLVPVGIPNSLLHNPLKSFGNARITP